MQISSLEHSRALSVISRYLMVMDLVSGDHLGAALDLVKTENPGATPSFAG